ncbi:YgaP family membrane protein [Thiocapsa marina]|uniref:Inner membrane protein YgaP-like transmembrane domain-containing protein n=1 Tax=Thiocapsa marina 5811 TaxID=768671 RepID=F9UET9_9GAMM|nr:DUF2892 domain-containing protein [Thiocapsa marina]EGV17410.1 hypothetical protein ThimaDRAFT_3442 [Thiocapsa marina 5811]
MELTKNIGEKDRKIRLAAGALIILWGVFAGSWLGLVGLVLMGTAFVRSCPAYSIMTMSTVEKQ